MHIKSYRILLCFIGSLLCHPTPAQLNATFYTDAGKTAMSNGFYLRTAGMAAYRFGNNQVGAGGQIDLVRYHENRSPGAYLDYSRFFSIRQFPLHAKGFFLHNRFSDLMYETNWGLLLESEQRHFVFRLGTHFRTFGHTHKAYELFEIENTEKVHENFNLLYSVSYFLKPRDSKWNLGITVTDLDHFLINQETNPVFYLRGMYRINEPLEVFLESWYKSAGALNLSVNPFGFFFRTGVLWKIEI